VANIESIENVAADLIVPITPHLRVISTSIKRLVVAVSTRGRREVRQKPDRTCYTDLSNGHSPAARARHKYAAIPTVMTAHPDAMYFHPLVVMMKIQPAMAIMLGSG